MWKNEEFSLTEKIFRETNYLVTAFSKTVAFTKFLSKVSENFCNFCTVSNFRVFPQKL